VTASGKSPLSEMTMTAFDFDRRRFLLTGAATLLGAGSVLGAPPKDDAGKARKSFRLAPPGGVECIDDVAFSDDRGTMALFQSDRTITAWETATGKHLGTLAGADFDYPDLFAVVGGGKTVLAWNRAGVCTAWEVKTGKARTVFEMEGGGDGTGGHSTGAAAADGKRIATVHDGGGCKTLIRAWDAGTGKELWKFNNDDGQQIVHAVAFSPDGKRLAAGTQDGRVKLFDPATGKVTTTLSGGSKGVTALDWSADGKRLVTSRRVAMSIVDVVVWDVAAGEVLGKLGRLEEVAAGPVLSPAGKHAAALLGTGRANSRLAIWDATGGKLLAEVNVVGRRGLAWSADGKSVLVVREYPEVHELLVFDLADIVPKK
jgi:Tol biopolymer transport system component